MGFDISYEYDAFGNRTKRVDNLLAQTTTYSYDVANQFTSSQVGASTTNYSYDKNGNLADDGTSTYTWDAENHLTRINTGMDGFSMDYNADGLRVSKALLSAPSNGTKYIWDRENYLMETDIGGPRRTTYTFLDSIR